MSTIKSESKKIAAWKKKLVEELQVLEASRDNMRKQADKLWSEDKDEWYKCIREVDKLNFEISRIQLDILPTNKKYFNEHCYSDVHAYVCIEECTPNKVKVVRMKVQEVYNMFRFDRNEQGEYSYIKFDTREDENGNVSISYYKKLHGEGEWSSITEHEAHDIIQTNGDMQATNERIESFIPGGFFGHTDNTLQRWNCEIPEEWRDDDIVVLRRHKNGRWYQVNNCNPFICSSEAYEFYDYNF